MLGFAVLVFLIYNAAIVKPHNDAKYQEYVAKGWRVYFGEVEAQMPPTYIPKNMVPVFDESKREIHLEYQGD